ncbi:MAG: hypothetical protein ACQES9_03155 [Myxococcota bacterium]
MNKQNSMSHFTLVTTVIIFFLFLVGGCKNNSKQTDEIQKNLIRIYLKPENKEDNLSQDLNTIAQRLQGISYFQKVQAAHDGTKYWISFNLKKDFNKQLKAVISFLIEIQGKISVKTVKSYPPEFFKEKRSSMISVDELGDLKLFKCIYRSVLEKFVNSLPGNHEFFIYQVRKGITEFSGKYNYAVLVDESVDFERISPEKLKITGKDNKNLAVLLDSLIIKLVKDKKLVNIDSRLIPRKVLLAIINSKKLQNRWSIHRMIVDRKI